MDVHVHVEGDAFNEIKICICDQKCSLHVFCANPLHVSHKYPCQPVEHSFPSVALLHVLLHYPMTDLPDTFLRLLVEQGSEMAEFSNNRGGCEGVCDGGDECAMRRWLARPVDVLYAA